MNKSPTPTSVRLRLETIAALRQEAAELGISYSEALRRRVENFPEARDARTLVVRLEAAVEQLEDLP